MFRKIECFSTTGKPFEKKLHVVSNDQQQDHFLDKAKVCVVILLGLVGLLVVDHLADRLIDLIVDKVVELRRQGSRSTLLNSDFIKCFEG